MVSENPSTPEDSKTLRRRRIARIITLGVVEIVRMIINAVRKTR